MMIGASGAAFKKSSEEASTEQQQADLAHCEQSSESSTASEAETAVDRRTFATFLNPKPKPATTQTVLTETNAGNEIPQTQPGIKANPASQQHQISNPKCSPNVRDQEKGLSARSPMPEPTATAIPPTIRSHASSTSSSTSNTNPTSTSRSVRTRNPNRVRSLRQDAAAEDLDLDETNSITDRGEDIDNDQHSSSTDTGGAQHPPEEDMTWEATEAPGRSNSNAASTLKGADVEDMTAWDAKDGAAKKRIRQEYSAVEVEIMERLYQTHKPKGDVEWEVFTAMLYDECIKVLPEYRMRDMKALRVKFSVLKKGKRKRLPGYSRTRGMRRKSSARNGEAHPMTSSEQDLINQFQDGKVGKVPKRSKNYSLVPVYENPTDALLSPPPRRTRPRQRGDIIGEALIFGDDLTWGMAHNFFGRSSKSHWPTLIKERFEGKGLRIVESCMPSRTTTFDDPKCGDWDFAGSSEMDFNGYFHFGPVFSSHSPLWVIVMLGTHDVKKRIREVAAGRRHLYNKNGLPPPPTSEVEQDKSDSAQEPEEPTQMTAARVAENCATIGFKARQLFQGHCHEGKLNILFVVPPQIRLTAVSRALGFDETSVKVSMEFPSAFKKVCERHGFLMAHRKFSMKHSVDGIHLTAKASAKLADTIWEVMTPSLPRETRKPERFQVIH